MSDQEDLAVFYSELSNGGKLNKRALCHIRALTSELAALREELESNKTALREEMKDAFEFQQRNAGLVGLLTRTLAYYTESCFPEDLLVEVKIAIGSLKPPESGASELDPKIIGIIPMPPMEYDEP